MIKFYRVKGYIRYLPVMHLHAYAVRHGVRREVVIPVELRDEALITTAHFVAQTIS